MRAAILSIGDELITGGTVDRNARWLADRLAGRAVVTVETRVVPDDQAAIAGAVRGLAAHADVLLVTGGLGPTADDRTRAALGEALTPGEPLVTDPEAERHLRRWFKDHGRPMPQSNLAQARIPAGARGLPNPHGTAMGIAGRLGTCRIFAMPGPPVELQPMFDDHVMPELSPSPDQSVRLTATVHAFGLSEAAADELLGPLHDHRPRLGVTIGVSVITAHVRSVGVGQQVADDIDSTCGEIMRRWSPYAFGRDDRTLSAAVGHLLATSGRSVATAESCTGGLLGKMIVDTAGASGYYRGGWITYTDALKVSALGVPPSELEAHGAVSEQVALAMALGALERSGASDSLAVTGVAGPGGGSTEKPVGTVFVALGRSVGGRDTATSRGFRFSGDRSAIRDRAVATALQMLRFALLEVPPDTRLLWEVTRSQAAGVP